MSIRKEINIGIFGIRTLEYSRKICEYYNNGNYGEYWDITQYKDIKINIFHYKYENIDIEDRPDLNYIILMIDTSLDFQYGSLLSQIKMFWPFRPVLLVDDISQDNNKILINTNVINMIERIYNVIWMTISINSYYNKYKPINYIIKLYKSEN